jgi:hypothetical protein
MSPAKNNQYLPGDTASESFNGGHMKQVPEDQVVVPRQEQVNRLKADLAGNQVFGRIRGRVSPFVSFVSHILEQADSPSDALRMYDDIVSDVRVMANLLAKYRRDGLNIAERELAVSLSDKTYLLPGEDLPIESLVPVTFVMFEPEKTMLMLRWVMNDSWQRLDEYLEGKKVTTLTMELFEAFPSLQQTARERWIRRDYEGWDLLMAHALDVIQKFPSLSKLDTIQIGRPVNLWKRFTVRYGDPYYNDHLEMQKEESREVDGQYVKYGRTFLYMFSGDQGEVLSHFTRDEQRSMATWQVYLPENMAPDRFGTKRLDIMAGIHPEADHGQYLEELPVYASRGVSHGWGLLVLRSGNWEKEKQYWGERWQEQNKPFRALLA